MTSRRAWRDSFRGCRHLIERSWRHFARFLAMQTGQSPMKATTSCEGRMGVHQPRLRPHRRGSLRLGASANPASAIFPRALRSRIHPVTRGLQFALPYGQLPISIRNRYDCTVLPFSGLVSMFCSCAPIGFLAGDGALHS